MATTIPASSTAGNLWWDSTGGELYVYYSGAWVSALNIGSAISNNPFGLTNQISFNNAGTESGDANLCWYPTTANLAVNGSITSKTITSNSVGANSITTNNITINANLTTNNITSTSTITTNNITSNTITANVVTNYVTANGSLGTTGQVLSSGGASSNDYWTTPPNLTYRNRIINGDMRIDQRNNGVSNTSVSSFTIDRWVWTTSQAGKITWGRNLNAIVGPLGLPYYMGFQSSSAYTPISTDYFEFYQPIEADAISDLQWGSVTCRPLTLSFWAYSSLGGVTPFSGAISNYAQTRGYAFSYSIPVANTWTYITVTIPGDTTGTWVMSGSAASMYLFFDLGGNTTRRTTAGVWTTTTNNLTGATGAVNVVGTSGATFYITGVQLELGTIATPFERLPPQVSLALCQRYYQCNGGLYCIGYGAAGGYFYDTYSFPVTMHHTPTMAMNTFTGVNNVIAATEMFCTQSAGGFIAQGQPTSTGIAFYIFNWTASAEL